MKRPKLRTKLTKNGRVMGRPVKLAETLVEDMPADPRPTRYDETLWIMHAVTGRGVRKLAAKLGAELRQEGVTIKDESVRRQLRRKRATFATKTCMLSDLEDS